MPVLLIVHRSRMMTAMDCRDSQTLAVTLGEADIMVRGHKKVPAWSRI